MLAKKSVEKIQEHHRQFKEVKDRVVALISDDLQIIKSDNVGLWGEIHEKDQQMERCENTTNCLKERYVPCANDPVKDNIIIVRKQELCL